MVENNVEDFELAQSVSQNVLLDKFVSKISDFCLEKKPDKNTLVKYKVSLCKELGLKKIPTDIDIFLRLPMDKVDSLKKILRTKPVRTFSGVATVAIMTKPLNCPHGRCVYCPGGLNSEFGDVPQSYTGNEPATMRAFRNNYDAYFQVMSRLEQYVAIAQSPEKIELIIMGGTFLSAPKDYIYSFVCDAFQALNDFSEYFYVDNEFDFVKFKQFFELPGDIKDKARAPRIHKKLLDLKDKLGSKSKVDFVDSLKIEHSRNEHSHIKCVGLTIETKPDVGFKEHGELALRLGCTRIELGVQTVYDEILQECKRGHNLQDSIKSIRELKDLGFKLNFHVMPGLPNVSRSRDISVFKELFDDPSFRPDMLKIYPLMVMPGTFVHELFSQKKYVPLNTEDSADIISEAFRFIPRYCRVMRVQRDIPPKYAVAGPDMSNLRQLVDECTSNKKIVQQDIRAREIKQGNIKEPVSLDIFEYDSSLGKDFFLSLNDDNDKLIGFLRLRFPSSFLRPEFTIASGVVRELHVYGVSERVSTRVLKGEVQHRGFGKRLMLEAERICRMHNKDKLLVISGVGVRKYYESLGYNNEGPYMVKSL